VRPATAGLIVSLLLNLALVGWVAWIVHDPPYWFPSAYSNKGIRGDPGPPGSKGPAGDQGPRGPGGPGVDDLQAQVDDLSSTVDDLSTTVDDLDSRLSDAESTLSDLCTTLEQAPAVQDDLSTVTCP
jgi:hypothetical protein